MQSFSLLNIAILGGVTGFAVYCIAAAAQVWRARNALPAAARPPRSRLRRIGAAALVLGLCCVGVAVALRAVASRQGRLTGENLFTLRAQKEVTVAELPAEGSIVASGSVLARFHSPKLQSELAGLELKKRILEAEQRIVAQEPVAPDPETARRQEELASERRHLQSSHDYLMPELALVARERNRDQSEKIEKIVHLNGEIERVRTEIAQAAIRRELHEGQRQRTETLARSSVASVDETAHREAEAKYSEAEVKKLERRLEDLLAEKKAMEQGLAQLQAIAESQAKTLNEHIGDLRRRLASLSADEALTREQLRQQLAAAEARREAKLAQIQFELQQCEHELRGLADTLTVPAPFAGRVAYRNSAPNAALEDESLLVLAPENGFILRLRLLGDEAPSLQKTSRVTVELTSGIERRFTARPLRWRRLAEEPSYAVAELTCAPPPEAVRDLTEGKPVDAKLRWTPPVYTHPLFIVGGACIAFSGLTNVMTRRQRQTEPHAADAGIVPAAQPSAAPAGVDESVEQLAMQLRESILAGEPDPHLLSAIEWSLDRHDVRAIRTLAIALGDDAELADRAEMLLLKLAEESDAALDARLLLRLTRILGALGGPQLQERLYELRHRAGAPAHAGGGHGHGNGNGNGRKHGNGTEKPHPLHV